MAEVKPSRRTLPWVIAGVDSTRINPMRREVVIPFDVPRAARATLKIFDLSGRLMRVLVDVTQ